MHGRAKFGFWIRNLRISSWYLATVRFIYFLLCMYLLNFDSLWVLFFVFGMVGMHQGMVWFSWSASLIACNWWLIFSYYKKKNNNIIDLCFTLVWRPILFIYSFVLFAPTIWSFLTYPWKICGVPFIRCTCLKEYLMILGCLLICNFCRADIQIRKALCLIVVYGWFIKISSYRYLHWIFAEVN